MKVVLQDGIKDCGVCCLLSIMRYYGGDISKELLREMTNTNKFGVSAFNLIEAAKKIGFIATGVSGDIENIQNTNLPCIAHIIINKSYKHFVVIYGINYENKKIVIMDPAKGKRKLSFGEFKLISSCNYIFLKPLKKLPFLTKKNVILKIIKEFILSERKILILIIVLSIISFLFQIIISFHFKYLLKLAITFKLIMPILVISFYLFFIYLFKEMSLLFRNILLVKWESLIDSSITFKTYKHIILLPYLYYKNRTTGEVISRLKDLNIIKTFLIDIFCFLVTDFISIFIFFFFLFKISNSLSVVIFCFCLILFIVQIIFSLFNKIYKKKINCIGDRVNSYLVESFSNIDAVKNCHLEKMFFDKFLLKYKKFLEHNYSFSFINEIFLFIRKSINNFLLLVILGYGSYLVIKNKLSLGDLIVFQSVFNYFLGSFNGLLIFLSDFSNFKLAYVRLEDIFTINCEKFQGGNYYLFCKLDGIISFNGLCYSVYNKSLFNNLSLYVFPGERILITGQSGCGKSTLMKILMRYFEVPFGYVSINNIDINHYHLDVLRKKIVYVSNLESLFTDTLYNNITLGRDILKEEFLKIVDITGVSDFITDDLGYKQLLEENGSNFSNGERQRIILARSLIKNSDIYIFDESFSQIDSCKTMLIMEKIFDYLKGKTIIVISHRLKEKKLFDRVLKLENGVINECKKL